MSSELTRCLLRGVEKTTEESAVWAPAGTIPSASNKPRVERLAEFWSATTVTQCCDQHHTVWPVEAAFGAELRGDHSARTENRLPREFYACVIKLEPTMHAAICAACIVAVPVSTVCCGRVMHAGFGAADFNTGSCTLAAQATATAALALPHGFLSHAVPSGPSPQSLVSPSRPSMTFGRRHNSSQLRA